MHDYVLGFSRKNKTLLNLLFNSRVNLNNAMERIVCDLCMPHAFFTGTFNCLAKKTFLHKIVKIPKRMLILAKRNSQMQHYNSEGVDIVLLAKCIIVRGGVVLLHGTLHDTFVDHV